MHLPIGIGFRFAQETATTAHRIQEAINGDPTEDDSDSGTVLEPGQDSPDNGGRDLQREQ